ncbi:hypothetical protein NitYY0826_C0211 [Nitratiruptor sp. YY08-26]|nr:hypothetical protein NitYY0813_C0210 [Nitratiruptor sp. YY08-13]BCD65305.1 hypothetical protein NitYY0826_C0211 [Nitratiruptor sp. YY08-26]
MIFAFETFSAVSIPHRHDTNNVKNATKKTTKEGFNTS